MDEEESQEVRQIAPKSFIDFSAIRTATKKLAKETAAEIPNEAIKLARSSAQKTVEGLGLIGRAGATGAKKVAEAAFDAITPNKVDIIEVPDGETPESMEAGGPKKKTKIAGQVAGVAAALPEEQEHVLLSDRGITLDDEDVAELRHILYSEIGNRSQDKRGLEARVVVNTALNRLAENRRRGRGPQTLAKVLREKNQYQGYGTKQYKLSKEGRGDPDKNEAIDAVLTELGSGQFADNTNGAFYYIHNDDETITYDDARPLYK